MGSIQDGPGPFAGLGLKFKILDVGARPEGPSSAYQPLLDRFDCTVLAFDPDPAVCAAVSDPARGVHCESCYVGDGRRQFFHHCRNHPNASSLYEPDLQVLRHFTALQALMEEYETTEVQTTRLDDIPRAAGADFAKLDVQGAELQVLQGGATALGATVVVQTEVEHLPVYRGQPLFAEVDQELRRQGFVFHRLHTVSSRPIAPFTIGGDPNRGLSQFVWSDAVYVKDFTRLDSWSPDQLVKGAAVAHFLYRSYDLAFHLLNHRDRREGGELARRYGESVSGRAAR